MSDYPIKENVDIWKDANPKEMEILEMVLQDDPKFAPVIDGLKRLGQWEADRAAAGKPLPKSCIFLLTKMTVLEEELNIMIHRMMDRLKLDRSSIDVRLVKNDKGALVPSVSVDPPKHWLKRIKFSNPPPGETVDDMAKAYIKAVIIDNYNELKQRTETRCAKIYTRRADVDQALEPWPSDNKG